MPRLPTGISQAFWYDPKKGSDKPEQGVQRAEIPRFAPARPYDSDRWTARGGQEHSGGGPHSAWSARDGETRAARVAGAQQASHATPTNNAVTAP